MQDSDYFPINCHNFTETETVFHARPQQKRIKKLKKFENRQLHSFLPSIVQNAAFHQAHKIPNLGTFLPAYWLSLLGSITKTKREKIIGEKKNSRTENKRQPMIDLNCKHLYTYLKGTR